MDLAAGAGRHVRLLRTRGFRVRAVDRDIGALHEFKGSDCEIIETDLQAGAPWPLGDGYGGIVDKLSVSPVVAGDRAGARTSGGGVIYETFAEGHEHFGRPSNSDFLRPGELLEVFATLTTVAFEQGEISVPRPAVVQRIAAVAGPLGRLPSASGLDSDGWQV